MWKELDLSGFDRVKSILEDKEDFMFYVKRYNRFNKVIDRHSININKSKSDIKKVGISIYEHKHIVELRYVSEYSRLNNVEVKVEVEDPYDLEDCIVKVIDKWNSDSRA